MNSDPCDWTMEKGVLMPLLMRFAPERKLINGVWKIAEKKTKKNLLSLIFGDKNGEAES